MLPARQIHLCFHIVTVSASELYQPLPFHPKREKNTAFVFLKHSQLHPVLKVKSHIFCSLVEGVYK